MKMTVFWDVSPCSLVQIDRLIALMMEAVSTSETSINLYWTTRRNIPEESHLQFDKDIAEKSYRAISCVSMDSVSSVSLPLSRFE
jgi:hypothetical protein